MADLETSPKRLRRAGLQRLAGLLTELRAIDELREGQPGRFQHGSISFLHFHYLPDGTIRADVRLSKRTITEYDVSDEAGQQELLSAIEEYLGG